MTEQAHHEAEPQPPTHPTKFELTITASGVVGTGTANQGEEK